MIEIPFDVGAVFFDAVGTLIDPIPSVSQVYFEVGIKYGSRCSLDEIKQRFVSAFAHEEQVDALNDYRTDEAREFQRWQAIVDAVFHELPDRSGCFRELFDYFANPKAWEFGPAMEAFRECKRRSLPLGIASNFDRRLRRVVEAMPELSGAKLLIISSEIGWKKPSRKFFDHLSRITELSPGQILFVGDDRENDYEGARNAGLQACLIERTSQVIAKIPRAR